MDVFPPEVIRILSFHGPVEVWVGGERTIASDKVAVAPFEDTAFLLVPRRSPLVDGLLASTATAVNARHPDGSYSLRMTGRAHAGIPLTRHPDRGALFPWVPKGSAPAALLVVPFVAHRIELTREVEGERARWFGATPAGKKAPPVTLSWLHAAFGGAGLVFVALAVAVPWTWLALQGPGYPWRPVALALAVGGGLSQVGAARLLTLNIAFRRWRDGRARESDAPVLSQGFLAPGQARTAGIACLGAALVLPALVGTLWDRTLGAITLLANGGWLLGPALLAHLSFGGAEPED